MLASPTRNDMRNQVRVGPRFYAKIALLLLLGFVIAAPVARVAVANSLDFENHYRRAMELPAETTNRPVGHVLYHAVLKVYRQIFPALSDSTVQLLGVLTFMAPVPVIIFYSLKMSSRGALPDLLTGGLALGLTIASPITIWSDNLFMIGYINPVVYHNPTLIALRLLLIPLFVLSLSALLPREFRHRRQRYFWLLAAAATGMLATLAKPSYTIALLPGLFLYAIWRRLRGGPVDWIFLIGGLCIPAGLVLTVEYLYTFAAGFEHGGAIMFGPLQFMTAWIPSWRIPLQLALSLAFPLSVLLLYQSEARRHLSLKLAWTVFGVAAVFTYTLYQDGPGFKSGDFLWTAYSALFVLKFASLNFLLEQIEIAARAQGAELSFRRQWIPARARLAIFIFAIHVISGIAYWHRFLSFA